MKNKKHKKLLKILGIFIIGILCICLIRYIRLPKDSSYDTGLYGTYTQDAYSGDDYKQTIKYTLNNNNTYEYYYCETINGNDNKTTRKHLINDTKKINNDITRITLNTDESEEILYKYKNMLGEFYEAKIPYRKKFDLKIKYKNFEYDDDDDYYINPGILFNKNGYFHYCNDVDNCKCNPNDEFKFFIYKRIGNYIYERYDGQWSIAFYIVDDGIFYPEYYKEED